MRARDVCVNVCMYCVYACMHVSVRGVCLYVMYVCMYVDGWADGCRMCVYGSVYACMYVCMYICMYVCLYVCIYAPTYVCLYICVNGYKYAYIHVVRASWEVRMISRIVGSVWVW